jgi:hypothetical protein
MARPTSTPTLRAGFLLSLPLEALANLAADNLSECSTEPIQHGLYENLHERHADDGGRG